MCVGGGGGGCVVVVVTVSDGGMKKPGGTAGMVAPPPPPLLTAKGLSVGGNGTFAYACPMVVGPTLGCDGGGGTMSLSDPGGNRGEMDVSCCCSGWFCCRCCCNVVNKSCSSMRVVIFVVVATVGTNDGCFAPTDGRGSNPGGAARGGSFELLVGIFGLLVLLLLLILVVGVELDLVLVVPMII